MKYYKFFWLGIILFLPQQHYAQISLEVNANVDVELSKAGAISRFYYNEINREKTDWNLNFQEINLLTKIILNPEWSVNTRFTLQRKYGRTFNVFRIPVLNLQWKPTDKAYSLQLGRIINPFGSFNRKQISTERDFIGRPLAYQYYTNISYRLGYRPQLGEMQDPALESPDWGSPISNYQGYASGLLFDWSITPGKLSWSTALTTGAANINDVFTQPLHLGLSSRLKYQIKYFWQQGISISYGGFMEEDDRVPDAEGLNNYTQLLIGTDYKLGFGFFELSGEAIFARYTVPEFSYVSTYFNLNQLHQLNAFSSYFNLKYEPPFLSGSYIAYRLDGLWFGNNDSIPEARWDNGVVRHTIAGGYRLTHYLWLRGSVSTQITQNFSHWNDQLGAFRLLLTAFY